MITPMRWVLAVSALLLLPVGANTPVGGNKPVGGGKPAPSPRPTPGQAVGGGGQHPVDTRPDPLCSRAAEHLEMLA